MQSIICYLNKKLFLCFGLLVSTICLTNLEGQNPVLEGQAPIAQRLERVLKTLQELVEQQAMKKHKKNPYYAENYNPLVLFYQGIANACCDFAKIEQEFMAGAFAHQKNILSQFDMLCKTIIDMDKILYKPSNLRPRHIRWLKDACYRFGKTAYALKNQKVQNQEDLMLINTIQNFTTTMNRDVLPPCALYTCTSFENMRDLLMHRPWEFFKKNWWWTIPVTLGGGKLLWDTLMNFDKQKTVNWYSKLVALLGGAFFSSGLGNALSPNRMDNLIYTEEKIYTPNDVDADFQYQEARVWPPIVARASVRHVAQARDEQDRLIFDTHDAQGNTVTLYRNQNGQFVRIRNGREEVINDMRQFQNLTARHSLDRDRLPLQLHNPRIGNRNVNMVVTSKPCLRQVGNDCAFHAMFNAVCFALNDMNLMKNREVFDQHLQAWKHYLAQNNLQIDNLNSQQIEALIRQFPFFQPIKNNAGQLLPNISIIDGLPHLENALITARNDEYEIFDNQLNQVNDDINRLRNNQPAQILQLVAQHEDWRFTPYVLNNIRNFRNNNNRQIIILNTGGFHWIAVVLFRQARRDHMWIADSYKNLDRRYNNIPRRLHNIFRSDPLPNVQIPQG